MIVQASLRRRTPIVGLGLLFVIGGLPGHARATPLATQDFIAMAAHCAAGVSVETLQAVARTESGFEPWVLHDNTTGLTELPTTLQEATTGATALIAKGDSVDLGLMQINSNNLSALGMSVGEALDPCSSLAGGAAVLQAAFGSDGGSGSDRVALLLALSRYNTGSPFKGIMNGYAHKVMANGLTPEPVSVSYQAAASASQVDSSAPPAWDIAASAQFAQSHGAPWLVSLTPASASDNNKPVRLSASTAPAMVAGSNEATSSPPSQ